MQKGRLSADRAGCLGLKKGTRWAQSATVTNPCTLFLHTTQPPFPPRGNFPAPPVVKYLTSPPSFALTLRKTSLSHSGPQRPPLRSPASRAAFLEAYAWGWGMACVGDDAAAADGGYQEVVAMMMSTSPRRLPPHPFLTSLTTSPPAPSHPHPPPSHPLKQHLGHGVPIPDIPHRPVVDPVWPPDPPPPPLTLSNSALAIGFPSLMAPMTLS